jgi:drug/metabolite transporter (DMT)-like permease
MTSGAILLIVASAFLHALWNALLKRQGADSIRAATVAVLAVAALSAAAVIPLWAGPSFASGKALAWALGSGVGEAGYFLTLSLSLRRAALGVAYTVARGTAIVLVWPISVLWLGEAVTPVGAAGAAVLCAGMALASLRPEPGNGSSGSGILWAVACGSFIALYHLCGKNALAAGAQPAALFAFSLAVAVPVNLAALGSGALARVREGLRRRPLSVAGAGVLCTASFLLFLQGLSLCGAGAALTLRNTSILFAQGMAWAIGERPTVRGAVGAALVFIGAALLAAPK